MAFEFDIRPSSLLNGLWIIKPSISYDKRGNIWTSFEKNKIESLLTANVIFKHDKFSYSCKDVIRGIHWDSKSWKLVTCVYGEIMQVVVDLRPASQTYFKYESFNISPQNQILLLIPPNMGNAYCVLSNEAVYHYKLAYEGDYIDADQQFSLKWNDPNIGINWPIKNPILSERDK